MSCLKEKIFKSRIETVGSFAHNIPVEQIKNEPMFFNSNFTFAYLKGGPITRSFLDELPIGWKNNVVFDSRVHMLMNGWYPAIPGWHHDDVPRPASKSEHFLQFDQPDYENPSYRSEHITGLLNAEVAPTLFAIGDFKMPGLPEGSLIYRNWHNVLEDLLNKGNLDTKFSKSGELVFFNCDTFHKCQKAIMPGWRWFGRISRKTDRTKKITNEIRVNAQVYLEFPMEGW